MINHRKKERAITHTINKDDAYILAVDLDGTFLESADRQKDELYNFLNNNDNIILVFNTGRNTELILPVLDDLFIPTPHYIIGDVGATVITGDTQQHVQPLQQEISNRWRETLKDISDIKELTQLNRQEQPQERRMSFYVEPDNKPEAIIEKLGQRNCDVLYSNGIYLDILATDVNKGSTLRALVDHLGIDHDRVIVAGDTMNDFSMYQTGYKGVVLNNSEEPLKQAAKDLDNAYYSDAPGTDGIFEALHHFGVTEKTQKDKQPKIQYGNSDLVMVYHRLPYKEVKEDGKTVRQKHSSPNGILPTLLGFFSNAQKGSWVAWSLSDTRTPENFEEHVEVDKEKYENLQVCRIPLTQEDVRIFYEVFSKESFWLLLHSFHEKAIFNHKHWDHFLEINRIFAEKAAQEAAENATVWIHDYNLWMVPGFLRQMRPDVKIAFYHHTPFPSADIFNMIPWRRDIINSLLQCDYVGFHIPQYVDNFTNVVRSNYPTTVNEKTEASPRFKTYGCAIGVDRYVSSLTTDLNTVRMGAHPVGINCDYIEELAQSEKVKALRAKIKDEVGDSQCIISIERTDYTKGPVDKLKGLEKFLEDHPEMRGKVSLIMVCTPPAKGMKIYDEIAQDIAYNVGVINGKYGSYEWTPIHFVNRMIPFEDVIAYYAAADVGWVTPLRDGLNLVAKEYVMANQASGKSGALVLSEFAGAAVELHGAFLVNPYDKADMSDVLYRALTADEADKDSRLQRMTRIIKKHDVAAWGRDFLADVNGEKIQDEFPDSTYIRAA